MITFTNVTKTYPDGTVAVDDLTLDIPEARLPRSSDRRAAARPRRCG